MDTHVPSLCGNAPLCAILSVEARSMYLRCLVFADYATMLASLTSYQTGSSPLASTTRDDSGGLAFVASLDVSTWDESRRSGLDLALRGSSADAIGGTLSSHFDDLQWF